MKTAEEWQKEFMDAGIGESVQAIAAIQRDALEAAVEAVEKEFHEYNDDAANAALSRASENVNALMPKENERGDE